MRAILFSVFCILFCGISSSCSEVEGCTNPNDDSYNAEATKDDGSCNDSLTVAKFLGNYNVTENCGSNINTYAITVGNTPGAYNISISNIKNFGNNIAITANVIQDSIIITSQIIDTTSLKISGNGNINLTNGNLSLDYTTTDTSTSSSTQCFILAVPQ